MKAREKERFLELERDITRTCGLGTQCSAGMYKFL